MAFLSKILRRTGQVKDSSLGRSLSFLTQYKMLHQKRNVSTLVNKIEDIKINHISEIDEKRTIRVTWSDKLSSDFPHIYLRDNCQCPACFHPTSKQRQLDLVKLIDVDIQAKDVTHEINEDVVVVNWPDNHESIFQGNWLRARMFPESWDNAHSSTLYKIRPVPWSSSSIIEKLPLIDYEELMYSDQILLEHLESLFVYGLSIIRNAPAESGILYELVKRVSHRYINKTHYGEIFTVKNKPSPNSLAYTASYLPLHVDLPFFSYQPHIQVLHCIEQSEGENSGTSLLADGFRAAEELRNTNPDAFDILTKVKFKFNDVGKDMYGDYNLEHERPTIGLDSFGNVESIGYSNHSRSSFINAPSAVIQDCYKAYYAFTASLYSDILYYKMKPGDIVCFNNKRVLHGRTAFDPNTTSRWLEGCYMDWDEVRSIYRVVRERMS